MNEHMARAGPGGPRRGLSRPCPDATALGAAGALALAGALAGAALLGGPGAGGVALGSTAASIGLLLLPYCWFGLRDPNRPVAVPFASRRLTVGAAGWLLLAYAVYAVGTGSVHPTAFAKLTAFVVAPFALVRAAPTPLVRVTWPDALALVAIWFPVEFRWLRDLWPWPEGRSAYAMSSLIAVDLALFLFVGLRRLDDVGYRFRPVRGDARAAAVNFATFAVLAIPIGLATDFVRFDPHSGPIELAGSFTTIFVTIALPEELLFRGLMQNLLQKTWGRPDRALLATSLIFGLAHLNNGPAPDWRYALLATLAGIFYGRAYRQSGGLLAAATVHAAVDTVWRGFFR